MKKTLICLLSQQHVPNLLSVNYWKPERLILVETAGMKSKKASEDFCNALQISNPNRQKYCEVIPIPKGKDSDFQTMLATFGKLITDASPDTEWIVNLTGGNKPMSIAAYEAFSRAANRRFIYTDIGASNKFVDFLTGKESIFDHKLSIEEFLTGYGFEYQKPIEAVRRAEERAKKHIEAAIIMAKHAMNIRCWRHNALNNNRERVDKFKNQKPGKTLDLEKNDLAPNIAEVRNVFCKMFGFTVQDGYLTGKIDKYVAKFIDGGWLEDFFWYILNQNQKELGLLEVRLGLEVRGKRGDTQPHELDVTFMKDDYTFEFMECKSGSQKHDEKGDIFYRIEAVRKMPGAGRTKSYFVTNSETFSEDGDKLKNASLERRAKSYDCKPILGNAIECLARNPDAATIKNIFGWK